MHDRRGQSRATGERRTVIDAAFCAFVRPRENGRGQKRL
jgi:hypothetical protein